MKNERKFEYQARKIRQLEEDLKQAKSSATALECENKSIQRKYEAALEAMSFFCSPINSPIRNPVLSARINASPYG